MPNINVSPNMNLPIPIVGQDPGPDYATNLDSCLTLVDQHNHSPGNGVQINPNGMNINSDLPINSNNLTLVRTVSFISLVATLPGISPNLGCIYVAGNELVYNDQAGNVVPITSNGSVNAGSGSITGLPSGTASASYSSGSGTFVWQSATNTPANMDLGSLILRNNAASSKGLTLSPPNSMAADIVQTLPAIPGSNGFMTMDTAGTMGTISQSGGITGTNIASQTIQQGNMALRPTGSSVAAGGYATSSSSGSVPITSSSPVDVNNLSVTITSTGRPIKIGIIPDGSATPSTIFVSNNANAVASLFLVRGSTTLLQEVIQQTQTGAGTNTIEIPVGSFNYIDPVAAGTYTYKVQAGVGGSSTIRVDYGILYAYEI